MAMSDEFLKDAALAGVKAPSGSSATSLADQFKADAATPAPAQPTRTFSDFVDFLADQPYQAGEAFGHHVGNFLHGSAQLIQNGLTSGAEAIAPNSSVAKYLRQTTDSDKAALTAREKEYQARIPDSPGSYAGAALGTIAPFAVGGDGGLSSGIRTVGDTVGKVPQLIGSKLGPYGKLAGDALSKVVSGATQGGIMGATQVQTGDGDYWDKALSNAKAGMLFGGGLAATGQLLKGGYNMAKSMAEPFFEGGQNSRVAQFLADNVADPKAVIKALRDVKEYLPGSSPTTAQAAGDTRLLAVERAAKNTQPYGTAFDDLSRANNEARVNALNKMAGTDGAYSDAMQARTNAANKLYGDAMAEGINKKAITPEIQARLDSVLQRPSMQSAMSQAEKSAAESGATLPSGLSLQKLDFAKKSLGDQIESQVRSGNNDAARLLMGTKNELDDLMATISPKYAQARQTFAALSKPLNQMEQVQGITGKLEAAPTDVSGIPQLTRAKYANALRQVDTKVMTPDQMNVLQSIKSDLNRSDLTNTAQRAVGSNTPQDLTNADLINKLLGKSTVLQKIPGVAAAGKALTENASNSMQKKLAEVLIDPAKASQALQMALDKNANPSLIKALLGDPATAALLRNSPQYGGSVANEVANLPYR